MSKRKLAFFDIDGTLFRWSLFIDYTEELIRRGIFPQGVEQEYRREYDSWQNREGSYEEFLQKMIKVFEENIAGVDADQFYLIVQEIAEKRKKHVYRFTRDLIASLKGQGYFLVAISHSAKMAVELFAKKHGFDKVYGVMFEIENGIFTGNFMHDELIFDKGKIIDRVLQKHAGEFTLEDSVAVGDTAGDISMLQKVQRPIAFNPNRALYETAKKEDWEIVVERKDLIYHINKCN